MRVSYYFCLFSTFSIQINPPGDEILQCFSMTRLIKTGTFWIHLTKLTANLMEVPDRQVPLFFWLDSRSVFFTTSVILQISRAGNVRKP